MITGISGFFGGLKQNWKNQKLLNVLHQKIE